MRLTFLGTSAGAPTKDRNVTGVALRRDNSWDLFDCGEATQHRLLSTPLTLPKLRRVFISHLHGDHCFGLFGLLGSRSMAGAKTPLHIYGPAGLEEMVRLVLETSDSHMVYPLEFHVVSENIARVVDDEDGTIDAIELDHRIASFGWCIRESERPGAFDHERAVELGVQAGEDFGRLQRGESVEGAKGLVTPSQVIGATRPGRSLIIAGDNRDPQSLLERSGPVQLLVHEATFTEDAVAKIGDDRGHSTAARVGKAAEAGGVGNVILTHFSPRYGPPGSSGQSVDDIRAEAKACFSGNLELAADYSSYELFLDGSLSSPAQP